MIRRHDSAGGMVIHLSADEPRCAGKPERKAMSEHTAETFHDLHKSVLTEAEGLVHGARNAAYGHPLDDFSRTAGMASAMLAHKLKEPLTAEEVGMFMCCVKLSRQVNAPKRDNMVDLAGYAETVQWCLDEREARV